MIPPLTRPFATFYCKNRYAVTPTSEALGKVNILKELVRTKFTSPMKYCSSMVFPNVFQMSPRCLPDSSSLISLS